MDHCRIQEHVEKCTKTSDKIFGPPDEVQKVVFQ